MRSTLITIVASLGLASAFPVDAVKRQMMSSASSVRSSATAAAAAPSASASSGVTNGTEPVNTTAGLTDLDILQFALALEQLEITLYRVGLNYSESDFQSAGYDSFVRQRFTEIVNEEQQHIALLENTIKSLGAVPNAYCEYSFPVTDVKSFAMVTQMVNDVGPGAYTGSSTLIQNKTILQTAAQILGVECRHNAWVRSDVNKGDAFPQTFQVSLTPQQAITLASAFAKRCPTTNTPLAVTAKPSISISPAGPYYAGQQITLRQGATFGPPNFVGNASATMVMNSTSTALPENLYAVFLDGAMPGFFPFVPINNGSVTIPQNVTGQSYVVVTSSPNTLTDANTVAGPAIVEVPINARDFAYQSNSPFGGL